jgi:hypothetical protein
MIRDLVVYSLNKVCTKEFLIFFGTSLISAFALSFRGQARNEIFQQASKLGAEGIKNISRSL